MGCWAAVCTCTYVHVCVCVCARACVRACINQSVRIWELSDKGWLHYFNHLKSPLSQLGCQLTCTLHAPHVVNRSKVSHSWKTSTTSSTLGTSPTSMRWRTWTASTTRWSPLCRTRGSSLPSQTCFLPSPNGSGATSTWSSAWGEVNFFLSFSGSRLQINYVRIGLTRKKNELSDSSFI